MGSLFSSEVMQAAATKADKVTFLANLSSVLFNEIYIPLP